MQFRHRKSFGSRRKIRHLMHRQPRRSPIRGDQIQIVASTDVYEMCHHVLASPSRDGAALADAVVGLAASDELRETIARTARRRAHQDFDVMKIINTVLDSYEEILAARTDEGRT